VPCMFPTRPVEDVCMIGSVLLQRHLFIMSANKKISKNLELSKKGRTFAAQRYRRVVLRVIETILSLMRVLR
ncbi:MAG: hypothetical protein MJZ89_04115, partial [Paludibacteraceae bacterium]|nr:hypothetical protein [Paludibacteraceae bacterium]